MKLLELFNKTQNYEITVDETDEFEAVFSSNGRDIRFSAGEGGTVGYWNADFIEQGKKGATTKMTGSGGEFEVMGTIKEIALAFVKSRNVKYIEFTAKHSDRGRVATYTRMVKRFTPPGYTYSIMNDDNGNSDSGGWVPDDAVVFTVTKDKPKKIAELLDTEVNYKVTTDKPYLFVVEAEIGGRRVIFAAECEMPAAKPQLWNTDFYEVTEDGEWSTEATGSGGELEVGSLIKKAFTEFIQTRKPEAVEFSAKLDQKNARTKIYQRMAKRVLGDKYTEQKEEVSTHHVYRYVRKMNEALDTAVDFKVVTDAENVFRARAKIGDRSIIFKAAALDYSLSEWDVEFVEDNGTWETTSKTGSGNEFEVGAMVKKAFEQFVRERKPKIISFLAKLDTKNSRARIYKRIADQILGDDYKSGEVEKNGRHAIFKYVRK
jgi:hypothetical protein